MQQRQGGAMNQQMLTNAQGFQNTIGNNSEKNKKSTANVSSKVDDASTMKMPGTQQMFPNLGPEEAIKESSSSTGKQIDGQYSQKGGKNKTIATDVSQKDQMNQYMIPPVQAPNESSLSTDHISALSSQSTMNTEVIDTQVSSSGEKINNLTDRSAAAFGNDQANIHNYPGMPNPMQMVNASNNAGQSIIPGTVGPNGMGMDQQN